MKLEEIKKLSELARIEMTEEEMLEINKDFEPILAYVGQIQNVSNLAPKQGLGESAVLENIVREDIVTNEPNSNSEKIIKEMPETQDGFLKVKQIL